MLSDDDIVEAMARAMDEEFCGTIDCTNLAQAALAAQRAMGLVVVPVADVRKCMAWIGDGPVECELHDRLETMIAATQGEMK
jgi:hypothetical protein